MSQRGKVKKGQVFITGHYADRKRHWPVNISHFHTCRLLRGWQEQPRIPPFPPSVRLVLVV
ncbi:MAG: hypothetical protein DRP79_06095 [Planctomycetota bacterium]|nr:MAG: hypothetical protein DRP79_06095 [Planctomycetota bacterium]